MHISIQKLYYLWKVAVVFYWKKNLSVGLCNVFLHSKTNIGLLNSLMCFDEFCGLDWGIKEEHFCKVLCLRCITNKQDKTVQTLSNFQFVVLYN